MTALLVLAACCSPGDAPASGRAASAPAIERTFRVGQIYVEGADDMSASAVLKELDFQTGDRVSYRQVREAERRLARLGLFVVDATSDVRPRVIPLGDGDGADVRVVVVRESSASAGR